MKGCGAYLHHQRQKEFKYHSMQLDPVKRVSTEENQCVVGRAQKRECSIDLCKWVQEAQNPG